MRALGLGVVLLAGMLHAQVTTPPLQLTGRLVVVNVSVTDRHGEPLRNLRADQFKVEEEQGLRREIVRQRVVSVEEHAVPYRSAGWVLPELPQGVYSNIPSAPVADALTVMLLDSQGTSVAEQQRLHQQMVKFARESPPGIRIAIFRTGPQLELLQGFTADRERLVEALERPDAQPAVPIRMARPDQVQGDSFDALASYLARFPGRKNILWFAASFPTDDPFTFNQNILFADVNVLEAGKDRAPVRDIVLYPIDPVAIAAPAQFNAANERGGGLGNPFAPRGERQTALIQTAMDQLARETGGKAFYNSNDLAGRMQKAIDAGSNYYTVAYVPTNTSTDGALRQVRIDVQAEGAHAAYRHQYVAREARPGDGPANAQRIALERGSPDSTQILFRTRVVPMPIQPDWSAGTARAGELSAGLKGPLVRYQIDWAADLHGITAPASPDGARHPGVMVAAIAYDERAMPINSVSAKVDDTLTPEQYEANLKTGLAYHQILDLPRGTAFLRLMIEDKQGRTGATEIALHVQP